MAPTQPLPKQHQQYPLCLLLLVFLFSCSHHSVQAIRPSLTPGAKVARKLFQKRPTFRHFFRTVADEQDLKGSADSENKRSLVKPSPSIGKGERIPPLDQLQFVDNTQRREELAAELSSLMRGIETLANQVEETQSIPPKAGKARAAKKKASSKKDAKRTEIRTIQELRQAILDDGKQLKDVQLSADAQLLVNATTQQLLSHDVVDLIAHRFKTGSTPGNRAPEDTAKLALAIEGGGMRGAVSAGMASAIACLGLCDCFDSIYGSSAGSVIGAYMVSRQMCMDVYVDILPAAQKRFVCTKRMMSSLAVTAVDMFLQGVRRRRDVADDESNDNELNLPKARFRSRAPGMNISFVLDGIMDPEHGIRPIDMESFERNNRRQPLNVASSYAKNGKLYTKCFSTEHFFGSQPTKRQDGKRQGLFACLEPSMTVPGATGPPVRLYTHDGGTNQTTLPFFDAFCFEPLPYRSAVDDGATHVLALCSRPEGFEPKTKPGVYENAIAPLYFKSHGEPEVAEFFARGGQQYIYLEDILTLEEGKVAGMNGQGPIAVPPAKILYGVEQDHDTHVYSSQRDEKWNKAHLLPLKVPLGTPELATLEQGKDAVREAVQGGFAAAFDLLAPAIGLNTHGDITGMEVARLVFPEQVGLLDEVILQEQKRIFGDSIIHREALDLGSEQATPSGMRREKRRKRDVFIKNARRVLRMSARSQERRNSISQEEQELGQKAIAFEQSYSQSKMMEPIAFTPGRSKQNAEQLLNSLPGIQSGKLSHLSLGLRDAASESDSSQPPKTTLKA